jgi:hypothetical protein
LVLCSWDNAESYNGRKIAVYTRNVKKITSSYDKTIEISSPSKTLLKMGGWQNTITQTVQQTSSPGDEKRGDNQLC